MMHRNDDEPLFEMEHDDDEIQPTTILTERPSPSPSNGSRTAGGGLPSSAVASATSGAQAPLKLMGVRYVMSSDTLLSESVNSSAGTVARTPPRQHSSSAQAFSPKAAAGSGATPLNTSQTRGAGSQTSEGSVSSLGAPPGTPQPQQQKPSSYDWIANPFSKSDIPQPPSRNLLSPQQSNNKGLTHDTDGSETGTVAPLRPLAQVRDSFGSAATLLASQPQGPTGNRALAANSNANNISAATANGLRSFADSFSSSSSKTGTIITTTTTRVNLSPCKSEDHSSPRNLSRTPSAVGQTKEYLFEFEDEDDD